MTVLLPDLRSAAPGAIAVGILYVCVVTFAWADVADSRATAFDVGAFDRVYVAGNVAVELSQIETAATSHSDVRVVLLDKPDSAAHQNRVRVETSDGVLYIDASAHPSQAAPLRFRVGIGELKEVVARGPGRIRAHGLHAASLVLEGDGAGRFDLTGVDVGELVVVGTNGAGFWLSGEALHQSVDLAGLGRYNGRRLHSRFSQVSLRDGGLAEVWADDLLDIDIHGVGDVRYNGSPRVSQNIRGRGVVTPVVEPASLNL